MSKSVVLICHCRQFKDTKVVSVRVTDSQLFFQNVMVKNKLFFSPTIFLSPTNFTNLTNLVNLLKMQVDEENKRLKKGKQNLVKKLPSMSILEINCPYSMLKMTWKMVPVVPSLGSLSKPRPLPHRVSLQEEGSP